MANLKKLQTLTNEDGSVIVIPRNVINEALKDIDNIFSQLKRLKQRLNKAKT